MNRGWHRVVFSVVFLAGGLGLAAGAAQAQDAATLFRNKCAMCHGEDGTGSDVGRALGVANLRSDDVQKLTNAQLTEVITNGKKKMPANKGNLTPAQIKSLVTYVRTFKKKS